MLEAAELLEHTQWKNGEDLDSRFVERKNEIAFELADILYWTLLLADDLKIDLESAFSEKLKANAEKYPLSSSKGSSAKYTEYD